MHDRDELVKFAQEVFNFLWEDELWSVNCVYSKDSDDYGDYDFCDGKDDIENDVLQSLRDCVKSASDVRMGATKAVFFFDEYPDLCFKIPLYGNCDYRWNTWGDYDLIDDKEFTGARIFGDREGGYDYCNVEARLYKMACDLGVDDMLASTEFLCDIEGLKVYVSQRCFDDFTCYSIDNRYVRRHSCEKRLSSLFEAMMSPLQINRMIQDYGIVKTYKLMKLFDEKLPSYDFHCGNFMEGDDGKIKCIDYSSFNG